ENFHIDTFALPYISYGAVFFMLLFFANLIARWLIDKYQLPVLGVSDPYIAAFLALIRTTFMISILLWIFHSLKLNFPAEWTDNSWILPIVSTIASDTINGIGKWIPFFSDIF